MGATREQVDAALIEAGKPVELVLTTLDGLKVSVKRLNPREVRAWWRWYYDEMPKRVKEFDEQMVELFSRCCLGEDGKPLYPTRDDVTALRDNPGGGAALAEFWTAARKINFLYASTADEENHRQAFIQGQRPENPAPDPSAGTSASTRSEGSPQPAE